MKRRRKDERLFLIFKIIRLLYPAPVREEVPEKSWAKSVGDGVAEGGREGVQNILENKGQKNHGKEKNNGKSKGAIGAIMIGGNMANDGNNSTRYKNSTNDGVNNVGTDVANNNRKSEPN